VSTRTAPKGKASASVDLGRKVDKLRKCRLTLTRHVLQDQYFLFPHLLNSRARRVAARDSLRRGASLREDESKREIHESGGRRREDERSSETPEDRRRPSPAACFFGKEIPGRQNPNERNNNERVGPLYTFQFPPGRLLYRPRVRGGFFMGTIVEKHLRPEHGIYIHIHVHAQTHMPARVRGF